MHIRTVARYCLATQIAIVCVFLPHIATAQDVGVQESVVRIIAGKEAATGFVWQGKNARYIVTSLHALAGATSIYYDRRSANSELTVYKIDKESDLALLLPKTGAIDKPALPLGSNAPASGRSYYIFGFPAGVMRVQGDTLEFSIATHNIPFRDYLPNSVVKDLTAPGYPKSSLKVLRVSSGITPGHSGAPIVDMNSKTVIGIGAGGLSKKGFRRVNWAVPAMTYLPIVEQRGTKEDVARLARAGDMQYSAMSETAPAPVATSLSKYYKIYEVPLDDLLNSLSEEEDDFGYQIVDDQTLNEINSEARELDYELSQAFIDVYQNAQTGAMVFIPKGASISSKEDVLTASNTSKVVMYFQIVQTESFNNAQLAMNKFMAFLDAELGTDWLVDEKETEDYPEDGIWDQYIVKYKPGISDDEFQSETKINIMIDYDNEERYGDILSVAVVGHDYPNFDYSDDVYLHQMDVCAMISGFVPN